MAPNSRSTSVSMARKPSSPPSAKISFTFLPHDARCRCPCPRGATPHVRVRRRATDVAGAHEPDEEHRAGQFHTLRHLSAPWCAAAPLERDVRLDVGHAGVSKSLQISVGQREGRLALGHPRPPPAPRTRPSAPSTPLRRASKFTVSSGVSERRDGLHGAVITSGIPVVMPPSRPPALFEARRNSPSASTMVVHKRPGTRGRLKAEAGIPRL